MRPTRTSARSCVAELEELKAKTKRIPFIDPIDIRYRRFENVPQAGGAGRDVLPDGRLGLDVRAHEGSRQALLHAALRVPDAALQACRDRLHPPYRRAEEVDEQTFFYGPASGGTLVSSALQAMREIVRERYQPGGLEHLRRAGLRRRQFLPTAS